MSVYEPDNFAGRVSLAASYISAGRDTTRTFDTCFEMYDGNAVSVALYRRAMRSPDGRLAQNLWRYLSRDSVEALAEANAHRSDLKAWSRELIARRQAENAAWNAYILELRHRPTYHDGTPRKKWHELGDVERESWIKNPTPRSYAPTQLDLFG